MSSTSIVRRRPVATYSLAPATLESIRAEAGRRGVSMSRVLDIAVESLCGAIAEHIAPSSPSTIADLELPTPARREEIRRAIRPTVRRPGGAR